jgi:hypothetical protein
MATSSSTRRMIGGIEETSASFEAGSAPRSYPTEVIARLQAAGLNATAVQNPLTTLPEAVESAQRVLARQDGPTVLVGHSFSGMIVTEARVTKAQPTLLASDTYYVAETEPGSLVGCGGWTAVSMAGNARRTDIPRRQLGGNFLRFRPTASYLFEAPGSTLRGAPFNHVAMMSRAVAAT